MLIDILFIALIIYGFYRGFSKGIIHSVFSMIGWILGLVLAFKLCTELSPKVGEWVHSNSQWVPELTFVLILIAVIVVVMLIGKMVEKVFDLTHLGMVNKIAGGILSCVVLFFIFCEVIGAMNQGNMISESAKQQSKLYSSIERIQPVMMDGVSVILPFAKTFMVEMKDKMNEFSDAKKIAPLVNQIH